VDRADGTLRGPGGYERSKRDDVARFERLVEERSSALVGSEWSGTDDAVSKTLQALLACTKADEVSFFSRAEDDGSWKVTHRAARASVRGGEPILASASRMPWAWSRLVDAMEPVAFDALHELPDEADLDRRHLESAGIHAAVCIPVVGGGKSRHAIVVAHAGPLRGPLQRFVPGLRLLGHVIASALERMRQAEALDRSWKTEVDRARRFTASALDALEGCACVVDETGIVVQASEAWRRLGAEPGAPEGVRIGGNFLRALETTGAPHADDGARLARGLKGVLAQQVPAYELEFARALPTGEPRWLLAKARSFTFDGRVYAAIDYRDVTGQRGTTAELEGLRAHHWHSDRVTRTGVLIASLAHELCQPLAAILSNAQAGLRRMGNDRRSGADRRADESEIVAILADIVADDKRAVQVIESLRLMLRRQATARRPVDLRDIVHDVVGLLRSEMVRQGVQLEVPHAAVGCLALVDRAQIQQVLMNIMLNGVEAMQGVPLGQRRLRVGVVRTGHGEAHLSVSDAGTGFTQEQLERCFEAFWTTKLRGTGLGLAICHSIVSSHGGRMWVEPKDGPGTTLVVALPIHLPSDPHASGEENGP